MKAADIIIKTENVKKRHKTGEEVVVEAPRGTIRYRIDKIER